MQLLTIKEITKRTGITPRSLKGWIKQGLIKAYKPNAKVILIDFEELQEMIKRGC